MAKRICTIPLFSSGQRGLLTPADSYCVYVFELFVIVHKIQRDRFPIQLSAIIISSHPLAEQSRKAKNDYEKQQ